MKMIKNKTKIWNWLSFLLVTFVVFVAYWFLFGIRYGWYLSPDNAKFLSIIFNSSAALTAILLVFYPSRILVFLIGLVCFLLPPLLRPEAFPRMEWPVLIPVGFVLMWLSIAAYLRQHVNDEPIKDSSDSV